MKQQCYQVPQCPICLQDLAQNIVVLRCGHCFHETCSIQSLMNIGRCPTCRQNNRFLDIFSIFYVATPTSHDKPFPRAERGQAELIQTLRNENQILKEKYSILENHMKEMQDKITSRQQTIATLKSEIKDKDRHRWYLQNQISEKIKQLTTKDNLLKQRKNIVNELKAELKRLGKNLSKMSQQKIKSNEEAKRSAEKNRSHQTLNDKQNVRKEQIITFGKPGVLIPKQNVPKVPKANDTKPKKNSGKVTKSLGKVQSLDNLCCKKEVRALNQAGTIYNTKRA